MRVIDILFWMDPTEIENDLNFLAKEHNLEYLLPKHKTIAIDVCKNVAEIAKNTTLSWKDIFLNINLSLEKEIVQDVPTPLLINWVITLTRYGVIKVANPIKENKEETIKSKEFLGMLERLRANLGNIEGQIVRSVYQTQIDALTTKFNLNAVYSFFEVQYEEMMLYQKTKMLATWGKIIPIQTILQGLEDGKAEWIEEHMQLFRLFYERRIADKIIELCDEAISITTFNGSVYTPAEQTEIKKELAEEQIRKNSRRIKRLFGLVEGRPQETTEYKYKAQFVRELTETVDQIIKEGKEVTQEVVAKRLCNIDKRTLRRWLDRHSIDWRKFAASRLERGHN